MEQIIIIMIEDQYHTRMPILALPAQAGEIPQWIIDRVKAEYPTMTVCHMLVPSFPHMLGRGNQLITI